MRVLDVESWSGHGAGRMDDTTSVEARVAGIIESEVRARTALAEVRLQAARAMIEKCEKLQNAMAQRIEAVETMARRSERERVLAEVAARPIPEATAELQRRRAWYEQLSQHLAVDSPIKVGDSLMGRRVVISDHDHGRSAETREMKRALDRAQEEIVQLRKAVETAYEYCKDEVDKHERVCNFLLLLDEEGCLHGRAREIYDAEKNNSADVVIELLRLAHNSGAFSARSPWRDSPGMDRAAKTMLDELDAADAADVAASAPDTDPLPPSAFGDFLKWVDKTFVPKLIDAAERVAAANPGGSKSRA